MSALRAVALSLIIKYKYFGLYISLALGILGLPVPDETLLTFAGFMVSKGQLHFPLTLFITLLGSLSGMSLSYIIGRYLGLPFLVKYGKYFHLTPEKLSKGQEWFQRYKGMSLVFGYFIPGFRHLNAYAAGMSKLTYPTFQLYAALGSVSWILTFLSLGQVAGEKWNIIGSLIHRYLWLGLTIGIIVVATFWWIRVRTRK